MVISVAVMAVSVAVMVVSFAAMVISPAVTVVGPAVTAFPIFMIIRKKAKSLCWNLAFMIVITVIVIFCPETVL